MLSLPHRATYADYLAVEQASERRHEFFDGVIVAMAGGSDEVLSPSCAGDDDGDKRRDFQSLASLQACVIAAQDARRAKIYRRTERGEWRAEPDVPREGDSFELPSLARSIAVEEVYDGILDGAGRSLLR